MLNAGRLDAWLAATGKGKRVPRGAGPFSVVQTYDQSLPTRLKRASAAYGPTIACG